MLAPLAASVRRSPDGRKARWEGFFVGHRVLDEERVAESAKRLLGMDVMAASEAARTALRPYRATPGSPAAPSLLLHSTTPTLRAFEGDLAALLNGQEPNDVATYAEARSVYLGTADDLAVGRTAPWAESVALRGVPAVDVGDLDHYYLMHALLPLAEAHEQGAATPLGRVVEWLRARPESVVRLYALDPEAQILLLWLRRKAGLTTLYTDANSPIVATRWNCKSHIHPTVEAALTLPGDVLRLPPEELLAAEQRLSEAHRQLGLRVPVLPGYTVPRAGATEDEFVARVLAAAELLRSRYGLRTAALKPSNAGDGARIVGDLDLADTGRLAREARAAHPVGDDHLLEAWVTFRTVSLDGTPVPVVPSGHVRDGNVADGITLQALEGFSWRGNTYLDEPGWTGLGLPADAYREIRDSLDAVRTAFHEPLGSTPGSTTGGAPGGDPSGGVTGLVTGGVDFALGRVGGRFGDRLLVGAIDFNLSSHGAESLRVFRDRARHRGVTEPYAATWVFRPAAAQTLHRMQRTAAELVPPGGMLDVVACVPRRWGMVAATGGSPDEAVRRTHTLAEAFHAV